MPAGPVLPLRSATLIGSLLSAQVAAQESTGAASRAGAGLFPAEREAVRTAGPQRQADFAAGRLCAHAALARLGVPPAPVLPGPGGEPWWPAGVTGSITHCAGYRACAVALAADVAGIGIDAEPDQPLPAGLLGMVATRAEQAFVAALPDAAQPAVSWDRLLFSAKEAACKLWYPLTGHWPAFHDVAIVLLDCGTFTARLAATVPAPVPPAAGQLTGRWLARRGLIVTALTCPPDAAGHGRHPVAAGAGGPGWSPVGPG